MSWSLKRKLLYLLGVLVVVLGFFLYFFNSLLFPEPTCRDGVKNGIEAGVDCGGECELLCELQVNPVSVLWSRAFQSIPGRYDVVAYIENVNASAGIEKLLYRFKVYDDKNVLINQRDGRTFLGPNQISAIFEGSIETGERIPKRVFFEIEPDYRWKDIGPEQKEIIVSTKNRILTGASSTPRFSVDLLNESLTTLRNLEVVVLVRGSDDTVVASSKTVVDELPKLTSRTVTFTWLSPFTEEVSRVEVIPRINPFALVLP